MFSISLSQTQFVVVVDRYFYSSHCDCCISLLLLAQYKPVCCCLPSWRSNARVLFAFTDIFRRFHVVAQFYISTIGARAIRSQRHCHSCAQLRWRRVQWVSEWIVVECGSTVASEKDEKNCFDDGKWAYRTSLTAMMTTNELKLNLENIRYQLVLFRRTDDSCTRWDAIWHSMTSGIQQGMRYTYFRWRECLCLWGKCYRKNTFDSIITFFLISCLHCVSYFCSALTLFE